MNIDIPGGSERRQTPRYKADLVLDMILEDGNVITVNTRNISSSGVQIACETWVTDKIEPRGIQGHSISNLQVKTVIELPVSNKSNDSNDNKEETSTEKLYASCRIMSVQRMSQDEYMLSLAFIDFENGSEKFLDQYLSQYKQKKTVLNKTIA